MEREKISINKYAKDIINIIGVLTIVFCMFWISSIKASAEIANNTDTSKNTYILTLVERDGQKEEIKGVDIQFKSNSEGSTSISFDENLLQEYINKL